MKKQNNQPARGAWSWLGGWYNAGGYI